MIVDSVHFSRMGTEKRPAQQACFLFIEYMGKNSSFYIQFQEQVCYADRLLSG